jgi:hypothetical protein
MAVTERESGKSGDESRRSPIAALQERFDALETNAKDRLRKALVTGNEKLRGLDEALARVAKDGLPVGDVRRHLGDLRARAENLRAAAVKRVGEIPGSAVTAIAEGGRSPVQSLARGLAELSKKLDERSAPKTTNGKTE